MFDIGIEKLIVAVCFLVIGWYARGGFTIFQRWLDRRRNDALKARRCADRKHVIALIEQAIAAEDRAFNLFQNALDGARKQGTFDQDAGFKRIRDIRNAFNLYSGLCGQIETALGGDTRPEFVINRHRLGLDPFRSNPDESGPQHKAASG